LLFHGKDGYSKTPLYYVIRTFPVSLYEHFTLPFQRHIAIAHVTSVTVYC